jgi:outer membrane protein OmpA-like peptidoglycan-associated protein
MKIQKLMRGLIAAILIATGGISLQAQTFNLVPNSGFEDTNIKKLKAYGQMEEFSMDWFAASTVPVDVYGEGAKGDKVGIPSNNFGKQEAAEGLCYAGFRAYSKDPKLSRNYLEVRLPQMLNSDVMYCVSFDISLADLSRYAVNEIGVLLSDRKIDQPNGGDMILNADIKHKTNKVFQYMEGWEKFCGTFVGTGEEEYLIIGGFGGRNDMSIERVTRPQGITGAQVNHAYYYIDNVSIVEIQAKSQCKCSKADERDMDLVYGSSSVQDDDMTDDEIVKSSVVYYPFLKRMPTGTGKATVASLVAILKANPDRGISIVGHSDDDERSEGAVTARYAKIGKNRADQIRRMLEAEGIAAARISVSDMSNMDPANTRDSEISRAQNRRVTFLLN